MHYTHIKEDGTAALSHEFWFIDLIKLTETLAWTQTMSKRRFKLSKTLDWAQTKKYRRFKLSKMLVWA